MAPAPPRLRGATAALAPRCASRRRPVRGSRIADQKAAALAAEQRRIGFGQPAGVGNEAGRGKVDRAGKSPARLGSRAAMPAHREPRPATPYCLARSRSLSALRQRRFRAIQLDPSGPPQQFRHAGLFDQSLMLDQAAPDQRQFGHRAVQRALRRRCEIVAHEPRQESGQVGEVIAHLRRAVEGVSQVLPEMPRKHVGKNRREFDHSRIAVAGFLAGQFCRSTRMTSRPRFCRCKAARRRPCPRRTRECRP